jgi:hypothetical protein
MARPRWPCLTMLLRGGVRLRLKAAAGAAQRWQCAATLAADLAGTLTGLQV